MLLPTLSPVSSQHHTGTGSQTHNFPVGFHLLFKVILKYPENCLDSILYILHLPITVVIWHYSVIRTEGTSHYDIVVIALIFLSLVIKVLQFRPEKPFSFVLMPFPRASCVG